MAKRYLYGAFLANGKWGMTTSKKKAIAAVEEHGGEVRAMALRGASDTYDAPTFIALSDRIAWEEADNTFCAYHNAPHL